MTEPTPTEAHADPLLLAPLSVRKRLDRIYTSRDEQNRFLRNRPAWLAELVRDRMQRRLDRLTADVAELKTRIDAQGGTDDTSD